MDFPGNSNAPKQNSVPPNRKAREPKDVQKVVSGQVIVRPKSIGSRAKTLFLGSEVKSAGNYIFMDVLVPALRNLIVDTSTKGIERLIYGESRPNRSQMGGNQTRFSYSTPPMRTGGYPPPQNRPMTKTDLGRRRNTVDYIVLLSKGEADLVLERLGDIVDAYGQASLADLYELVGFPHSYTDDDWGWYTITSAVVKQQREGWLLDLPPVEPLK